MLRSVPMRSIFTPLEVAVALSLLLVRPVVADAKPWPIAFNSQASIGPDGECNGTREMQQEKEKKRTSD